MMIRIKRLVKASAILLSAPAFCGASQPSGSVPPAKASAAHAGKKETGLASVYHDHRTASGERFNPRALTGAHRTLPFGSLVRVTAVRTGRSTVIRINDRGPFIRGRVIDLSPAAAASIGLHKGMGITKVELAKVP